MNSLKINFDKEELEIDGTKITNPFIVKVPHDDGYQRAKVFNRENGWKAGEKLPCISIQGGERVKKQEDLLIEELAAHTREIVKKDTVSYEGEIVDKTRALAALITASKRDIKKESDSGEIKEKIEKEFSNRLRGYATPSQYVQPIIDVIETLTDRGLSVELAQAVLNDAARIITLITSV